MNWILIIMLLTPFGPVPSTQTFEFNYQCQIELQRLQAQYPGSHGSCTYKG